MLSPGTTKFRKAFKAPPFGKATTGNNVEFGAFGIKALSETRLSAAVIEALRKTMMKTIRTTSGGRLWIRVFPHTPVSKKPAEVRMGKGKGSVEYYAAKVWKGTILFEFTGVTRDIARRIISSIKSKIGIPCALVERQVGGVEDFYYGE